MAMLFHGRMPRFRKPWRMPKRALVISMKKWSRSPARNGRLTSQWIPVLPKRSRLWCTGPFADQNQLYNFHYLWNQWFARFNNFNPCFFIFDCCNRPSVLNAGCWHQLPLAIAVWIHAALWASVPLSRYGIACIQSLTWLRDGKKKLISILLVGSRVKTSSLFVLWWSEFPTSWLLHIHWCC